jgi:hypothetical protein
MPLLPHRKDLYSRVENCPWVTQNWEYNKFKGKQFSLLTFVLVKMTLILIDKSTAMSGKGLLIAAKTKLDIGQR